jgi:hypothetical protein
MKQSTPTPMSLIFLVMALELPPTPPLLARSLLLESNFRLDVLFILLLRERERGSVMIMIGTTTKNGL